MSTTTRLITCTSEDLFRVLSDGWTYSTWVVGAARIRDVSPDWPAVGATIHHSVGAWPLLLDDTTTVRRYEPSRLLELTVRAWPSGEGIVRFTCEQGPEGLRVTMFEEPARGPARYVPAPLRDALLDKRNTETLGRLALRAERSRVTASARRG